jgi:hypothetical protein
VCKINFVSDLILTVLLASLSHDMACRDADGGDDFQMWRVAANILNKQPRTDDKG